MLKLVHPAAASSRRYVALRPWTAVSAAVAIAFSVWSIMFSREILAATYQWTHSAAFNYCFLVFPLAAYLLWNRREALFAARLEPAPRIGLLGVLPAALWFLSERLGVMEGRQLAAMALLQVIFAAALGWRAWRVLAVPLLYLFFMVPVGEFLIPALIWITVHFATLALTICGVPNFAQGGIIEIPQMTFGVGDQCSGFNYLLSSTAFGVFYASLMYTSRTRRIWFVLFSMLIPILANGIRVAGIIVLGQFVSAEVIELDHTGWGWYFFSFVILLQILAGLPFRQERLHGSLLHTADAAPMRPGILAAAVFPIMFLAAIPPAVAAQFGRVDDESRGTMELDWPVASGCIVVQTPAKMIATELPANASVVVAADYHCSGDQFLLFLYRFPPRSSADAIFAFLRKMMETQPWYALRALRAGRDSEPPIWYINDKANLAVNGGSCRAVATALWVAGRPASVGLSARLDQVLNSIRYFPVAPVIAVLTRSCDTPYSADALQAFDDFLRRISLSTSIDQWARGN